MKDNNTDNFVWTDELVKQVIYWIGRGLISEERVSDEVGRYKFIKTPSKSEIQSKGNGWEIVNYVKDGGEQLYPANYPAKEFLHQFKIHSVKRLPDGEIFSVGDEDLAYGVISRFYIESDRMFVSCEKCTCTFGELKKKKQPLFTSIDGKEMYEGDKYFTVSDNFEVFVTPFLSKHHEDNGWKRAFSTEEAANEYCILNKPCLSVQDVMNRLHAYFQYPELALQNIKQFSKSKLSQ